MNGVEISARTLGQNVIVYLMKRTGRRFDCRFCINEIGNRFKWGVATKWDMVTRRIVVWGKGCEVRGLERENMARQRRWRWQRRCGGCLHIILKFNWVLPLGEEVTEIAWGFLWEYGSVLVPARAPSGTQAWRRRWRLLPLTPLPVIKQIIKDDAASRRRLPSASSTTPTTSPSPLRNNVAMHW